MSMPFTALKLFSKGGFQVSNRERGLSHGTIVTSYITLSQLVHEGVHVCVCEQQMTDVYPLPHCLFILQCKLMPLIYY